MNFTFPETRDIVLRDTEDRMIVSSFLWTKHQHVTDRQTDRPAIANTALCSICYCFRFLAAYWSYYHNAVTGGGGWFLRNIHTTLILLLGLEVNFRASELRSGKCLSVRCFMNIMWPWIGAVNSPGILLFKNSLSWCLHFLAVIFVYP